MNAPRYTGIGNRDAPPRALALCQEVARELASRGLVLRTGDARGADAAFKRGCLDVEGAEETWPGVVRHDHSPEAVREAEDMIRAAGLPPDPQPPQGLARILAEVYAPAIRCKWTHKLGQHVVRTGGEPPPWALALAADLLPPRERLKHREPTTWALFARSMQQVLGEDGRSPSKFLLCHARHPNPDTLQAGGTRMAVRCALQPEARAALGLPGNVIPVLNLLGLTVADALAFAHEHAGVAVLRPGDHLPRQLVPDGALVFGGSGSYHLKIAGTGRVVRASAINSGPSPRWRGWADFPGTFAGWGWNLGADVDCSLMLIALGLTPETATAENLERLALEHDRKTR